jgi:virulence factor Mce-like protein
VILAAVTVLVVAVFTVGSRSSTPHRVSVVVPEAVNVTPGQEIRSGRVKVGRVDELTPVGRGIAARITLRIDDPDVWPLTTASTMELRFGGTAAFQNRYIELIRGPRGAREIPDGGTLTRKAFKTPVEFDTLLSTFDRPLRQDTQALVDRGGVAFSTAEPGLARAISRAPAPLEQTDAVLMDLTADPDAVRRLVRSTTDVVGAVHDADPGLGELLGGTATTIAAVSDKAVQLKQTLQQLPGTLAQANTTLTGARQTLERAADLTDHLAPGVRELRKVAAPLNTTLKSITAVSPSLRATLATAKSSTPQINKLLSRVTSVSPQVESIGKQATTQVGCLRPYTPELLALTTTWGDFLSSTDGHDRYLRAQIQNYLPAFGPDIPYDSLEASKLFPQLRFAFPKPPGYNANQPWFQPQCGVGPDVLDPAKDKERFSKP